MLSRSNEWGLLGNLPKQQRVATYDSARNWIHRQRTGENLSKVWSWTTMNWKFWKNQPVKKKWKRTNSNPMLDARGWVRWGKKKRLLQSATKESQNEREKEVQESQWRPQGQTWFFFDHDSLLHFEDLEPFSGMIEQCWNATNGNARAICARWPCVRRKKGWENISTLTTKAYRSCGSEGV